MPDQPALVRVAQPAESDGVPLPQRYWAILTIALGLTLAVLDGAIANVALPTIARDVNASPSASIWVVNAYQLAVTISLLPLASLGEIYGYRRVYQWGLVVFTIASLCCALSDSLITLTMARIVQGFGAAGIMSVNGALVRFIYPRRWLGRGVGLNATVGSVASALGPTVAAAILSVANWPWLFAVNIPLGLIAIPIAWRALPATPRAGIGFDAASAGLSAATFGILITAIAGLGHGESISYVGAELVLALGLAIVLVARQLSRTAPLLPVDLLRSPLFALSVATSVCGFSAQAMALVSLPFLFENTLRLNEVHHRPADDPLAADRRGDRTLHRAAGRPLSGGHSQRHRPGDDGGRTVAARGDAGASHHVRYRLAHDGVRFRVRLLQHAEQPGDPDLGACRAVRRRERHAGDIAAAGPDAGCRAGGAGVRAVPAARHHHDAGVRRQHLGLRRLYQPDPHGGAVGAVGAVGQHHSGGCRSALMARCKPARDLRMALRADVPEHAGHQPQAVAEQRSQPVLIGSVLAAAAVGVRYPHHGNGEHLPEIL